MWCYFKFSKKNPTTTRQPATQTGITQASGSTIWCFHCEKQGHHVNHIKKGGPYGKGLYIENIVHEDAEEEGNNVTVYDDDDRYRGIYSQSVMQGNYQWLGLISLALQFHIYSAIPSATDVFTEDQVLGIINNHQK